MVSRLLAQRSGKDLGCRNSGCISVESVKSLCSPTSCREILSEGDGEIGEPSVIPSGYLGDIYILWRDNGMLKGWLYDWGGMATTGKQNPETRFVESLLVVYLYVSSLSPIDA